MDGENSFEKPTDARETEQKQAGDSALFIRHGSARYEKDLDTIINKPMEKTSFDPKKKAEDYSDLTEKGVESAHEEAGKLLDTLHTADDVIYIAASPAERAVQTAYIYVEEARRRGFTVIDHKEKSIPTEKETPSGVRAFKTLESINMQLPGYVIDIFTPEALYPEGLKNLIAEDKWDDIFSGETPWVHIPREAQEHWIEAKKAVLKDDRGSWAENFFRHSATIEKIFPEVKESVGYSKKRIEKAARLFKEGLKKFTEDERFKDKHLKVLAFGHEELVWHLGNIFGGEEAQMQNLEIINFIPERNGEYHIVKGSKKGMISIK